MTRRRQVLAFLAGTAAVCGAGPLAVPGAAAAWAVPAAHGAVPAAGSWGRAIEVPGLGALNKGGNAYVSSVSCGSAGNCAAGGSYRNHGNQGFVVNERHGRWGRAIEVPGLGALNKGGNAYVSSVSCGSAGNCAIGGYYATQLRHQQAFVASESNGHWRMAIKVPGLAALNTGRQAEVFSVSCAAPSACSAGGFYTDGGGHQQGFVVSERNGRWGQAIEVPGLGALNTNGSAEVSSVSCASPGNCAAGGFYTDSGGHQQGFVASESNGAWGQATEVPGLGALNTISDAHVLSVSCASPGNCTAGGNYNFGGDGSGQGFVASESNGAWGQATGVPGLAALNTNGDAYVDSLSCASPGNCTAGGDYNYDYNWGFVASEKNGAWRAINVPGLGALTSGRFTDVLSVSCASPGNCAAGGDYEKLTSFSLPQGFVVSERNGRWGRAIEVPGLAALNKSGNASVASVSCALAGNCVAGGSYKDGHRHEQGFVT